MAPEASPITGLTAGAWTWVPFPQARCRDGSSTGIGVNLGTSDHLMIFLEGGGGCLNAATCGANPSSFDAAAFDSRVASTVDEVGLNAGILDRTNASNPVKDWSFVYVPYCTGDYHAGNNVTTVPGVGGAPQQFVGYTNLGLYLDRLVPTFHDATQVLLAGVSAGGFGASLDYARVAAAFGGTPVTLLDDSGPFMEAPYFPTCLQDEVRALWGLDGTVLRDCDGDCTSDGSIFLDLVKHASNAYPSVGLGLAESTEDSTVISGWNAPCSDAGPLNDPTFTAGLADIREQLASNSRYEEFLFAGTDHTTIQSAAFYTRRSGIQGLSMTDWVAGLLGGAGCTPKKCADFPPGTCGVQDDTCGGFTDVCFATDAGMCPPGQYCGAAEAGLCGVSTMIVCPGEVHPLQCQYSFAPGVACGQQSDGFGGLIDCGQCPSPLVCTANGCTWPADAGPCVPVTCQGAGFDCGQILDGCGHVLDCGTCGVSQFCGGGGPHHCGGTCSAATLSPCPVFGTCSSDAGSCLETVSCEALDGGCGLLDGACGGLIDCGSCSGEAGALDAPGQ
jgi:hypothetical protein